jgi:glycosyltransferase involved in cell wall biosynthesis
VVTAKPVLLFVSPQFLFPMDAGGKIRSANILKHLKGGAFKTRLVMPARLPEQSRWRRDIESLADEVIRIPCAPRGIYRKLRRVRGLATSLPVSAYADADDGARVAVATTLAPGADLVVFDYVQSMAMAPPDLTIPHLFFAHNVESEILDRHAAIASGLMKGIWSREAAKMRRFETRACEKATGVIAVSERDAAIFRSEFGAKHAFAIPTGVDPDYFAFAPPADDAPPDIVFTGSMDWKANQDGLVWFMDAVWPLIASARPQARLTLVGKNPPKAMIAAAKARRLNWRFTGFVDDIRGHARAAAAIIPLRIGGGTRIKAFEAMAMGTPVVSTSLGVEGLPVRAGEHFLEADAPGDFAQCVLRLLAEPVLRRTLTAKARRLVEENFSHRAAAKVFEQHCLAVLNAAR